MRVSVLGWIAGAVGAAAGAAAQGNAGEQFWHERYHGLLSMAAYGDWQTTCANTFTTQTLHQSFPNSNADPMTVISQWGPTASGLSGFNVIIPEMDKVVMVFRGIWGWDQQFNRSVTPLNALNLNCPNCTAHAGAYQAYLEAREATDDWAAVKAAVSQTGHQWSITGHGFGGMVAQIASLDLGWRGLAHWTHNHGSARVFNAASANIFNRLFQGEASQRVVYNNDNQPELIPEGPDYVHALSTFKIWGTGSTNNTYGLNWTPCEQQLNDPNCAGGDNPVDNLYYYTPIGFCGSNAHKNYDAAYQQHFLDSALASFSATATFASSTSAVPSSTIPPASSTDVPPSSTQPPQQDVSTTFVDPSSAGSKPTSAAYTSHATPSFAVPGLLTAFTAALVGAAAVVRF